MHSLTIEEIYSIEHLNHPHDWYIYFRGGYLVFNAANGPLRFWYKGDLVCIENEDDIQRLMKTYMDEDFYWRQ